MAIFLPKRILKPYYADQVTSMDVVEIIQMWITSVFFLKVPSL